jgi:hypothetical protein
MHVIRRCSAILSGALAMTAFALPAAASGYAECSPRPATTGVEAWLSTGGGVRRPKHGGSSGYFEIAVDLAATFPLGDAVRIGPWGRVGSTPWTFNPGTGLRLVFAPQEVDWFQTRGRWEIALDFGAGYSWRREELAELYGSQFVGTGRVSFGFRSPLRLYGLSGRCSCPPQPIPGSSESTEPWTCRPKVGVVSGVRLYSGVRRSLHGADIWEVSFGLSFEPLGSIWFLTGAH